MAQQSSGSSGSYCRLAAALAAVVFLQGCDLFSKDDAPATAAQAEPVTSDQLWRAYVHRSRSKADAAVARKILDAPEIVVSGTLIAVDARDTPYPVLVLRSPETHRPLRATPRPDMRMKVAELEAERDIVLCCTAVGEVAGSPMLRNCAF